MLTLSLATRIKKGTDSSPYKLDVDAKPILTANEREFFYRLVGALPQYHIFPQVSFSAILKPGKSTSGKERYSNLGRFNQKTADFVVCAPQTLEVLAVIELDDSTHNADKDRKRDQILDCAGYRTIRFQSRKKPSEAEIAAYFEKAGCSF